MAMMMWLAIPLEHDEVDEWTTPQMHDDVAEISYSTKDLFFF
jgi:hypothetical protein